MGQKGGTNVMLLPHTADVGGSGGAGVPVAAVIGAIFGIILLAAIVIAIILLLMLCMEPKVDVLLAK